ncbi:transposase [Streptomyces sp. NPDC013012]|uniref:transposase n=1 Tax=Streptomyces sp. NPDC013012 TaxID=3364860 RepID=UPI003695B7BA
MGRGDLTDEQWAVPEPLLPKDARVGRPLVWPRRRLIDGTRFRVRTGVPWRDVPVAYGPWSRIYDSFRRWQRNGTWQRILTRLQSLADSEGAIAWDLGVHSTVCRAHQHAAGAHKQGNLQKEPPGGMFTESDDHGPGRKEPGRGHETRQARGPLRSHCPRSDHQRMAVTSSTRSEGRVSAELWRFRC